MPTTKTRNRTKPAQAHLSQNTPVKTNLPPVVAREAAAKTAPSTRMPGGKLGQLVELLKRSQGAYLSEMVQVTGWQAASVRGAMAGTLKKKFCLAIIAQKTKAGRIYRIVQDVAR